MLWGIPYVTGQVIPVIISLVVNHSTVRKTITVRFRYVNLNHWKNRDFENKD